MLMHKNLIATVDPTTEPGLGKYMHPNGLAQRTTHTPNIYGLFH